MASGEKVVISGKLTKLLWNGGTRPELAGQLQRDEFGHLPARLRSMEPRQPCRADDPGRSCTCRQCRFERQVGHCGIAPRSPYQGGVVSLTLEDLVDAEGR